MPVKKAWSERASKGLSEITNAAEIRENIVTWVDQNAQGWVVEVVQRKSFPGQIGLVAVEAIKTGPDRVTIESVEQGW